MSWSHCVELLLDCRSQPKRDARSAEVYWCRLNRHQSLPGQVFVGLLSAALAISLPVVQQRLRTVCLRELESPYVAEERGEPFWPWFEPRNHCSARVLASLTPPVAAARLREEFERQSDRVVRFWLSFGIARARDSLSLFTECLQLVQGDDFGTWSDNGWGPNCGSLCGAYDLLTSDAHLELDAKLGASEVGRFILASAASDKTLATSASAESCDERILPKEEADTIGRAWLTQRPWLDRHDPEPYQFMPSRLQRMDRSLAGQVVTHILRSRIGYVHPEYGERLMDGGQASAYAIFPLGNFEPDFRGLFEVFVNDGGEDATSYQAAAAAAYSDDIRALLETLADSLRSPSSTRRRQVGRFLEYYTRYHTEGRNIPTWGGGGEPVDVLPKPDMGDDTNNTVARLSSRVRGPTEVVPGQTFELQIELHFDPTGELVIAQLEEGWGLVSLTAIASTSGAICEQPLGALVVDRNAGGGSVVFEFRAPLDSTDDSIVVRVLFFHRARYCGSVVRVLGVGVDGVEESTVVLDSGANEPDVVVTMFRVGKDRLAWHMHLSRSMQAVLGQHQLALQSSTSVVDNVIEFFDNTYPVLIETSLDLWSDTIIQFGQRIAELAPPELRQLFASLRAKVGTFSVQFILDECDIPWELMAIADANCDYLPLGAACAVARWSCKHEGWMTTQLCRTPFLTVVPQYVDDPLPQAEAEASDLEGVGAERSRSGG